MNKKQMIELNGIANISMLMQCEIDKAHDLQNGGEIYYMNKETYDAINQQLKYLEKYMRAYNDAINRGVQTPFWHDIRDNK